MFSLTREERLTLIFLASVLFAGFCLEQIFSKYPQWRKLLTEVRAEEFVQPVDLNRATVRQLDALPGIGPQRAATIVAVRARMGGFNDLDEARRMIGMEEFRWKRLERYLKLKPVRP